MHYLAAAANGSLATIAVASLVAPAVMSPKTITYVSLATVANVSPMTVAVQSRESLYQELVLGQVQRLAFNIVDNLSHRRTHMAILTMCHCYCEPFLGDAVLKYHIPIAGLVIAPVGQWVLAFI